MSPHDEQKGTDEENCIKECPVKCPSLAQTHMQGPMGVAVNGSGKSLSREELEIVKKDLAKIKAEHNLKEPSRSFMDNPDTKWRFGGPPDYSLTNYMYLRQKTHHHPEGSLEEIVENLVKTWEMERSHKVDCNQHESVDTEKFQISANGGKVYNNQEANKVGNYNVLLDAAPKDLYDASNMTWEDSHDKFHTAFAAFPWEVLEVYSGPPTVAFTWRHWGTFTGTYDGKQGTGELVEMFGFGLATVNDKLQLVDVKIYYDAKEFLEIMRGQKSPDQANSNWKAGKCPHLEEMLSSKNGSATVKKNGSTILMSQVAAVVFALALLIMLILFYLK